MNDCRACGQRPCVCKSANGPKQPYDEPCEHEYDEDEDAGEYVCNIPGCGHREPMPLDRIIAG